MKYEKFGSPSSVYTQKDDKDKKIMDQKLPI